MPHILFGEKQQGAARRQWMLVRDANRLRGSRRRTEAARSLIAQAGSMEVVLTWNAPAHDTGIAGWKVYQYSGNQKTLIETIRDPKRMLARIKQPANTNALFSVVSFNARGNESPETYVIAKANTDKYVAAGTAGETGGSSPPPPPEWPSEPRGGRPGEPV